MSAKVSRTVLKTSTSGDRRAEFNHEEDAWFPHEPDHIIATKHRGRTDEANLAWTCLAWK